MTDSFIVESTPKEYKLVPAGSHLARCYRIVDLGTQKSSYDGNVKFLRKVLINWELHSEDAEGQPLVTDKGEPLSIQREYTLAFVEKANLRIDIQNWFGKTFTDQEAMRYDLKNILGEWGMVSVIHQTNGKGKTFANVKTVSAVPNIYIKAGLPQPHNPIQMFRIAAPDLALFEKLPNWLKTKIFLSPEGQAMKITHQLSDPKPYGSEQGAQGAQSVQGQKSSGFDDMADDIPF